MTDTLIKEIRSRSEFGRCFDSDHQRRVSIERRMAEVNRNARTWSLIGYCEACAKPSVFLVDWAYSTDAEEGRIPNYRERLICEYCGLNNRQRFMARVLKQKLQINCRCDASIYLYEQVTEFYKKISSLVGDAVVTGSEYLGYDKSPGQVVGNIRHEDALSLSFKEDAFDIVVSNDVFEHVPCIATALKESCRVTRPGGSLLFTVPFHPGSDLTQQRASVQNNMLKHLLPECYHGNPVSDKGSLVFYDFGWDLLEMCRTAGFKDAYLLAYHSFMYGYLGQGLQFMFVAQK